jgi:hypothetical protein
VLIERIKDKKGGTQMTRQVSLLVNDQPIGLDYFVQNFIDHTIGGMLAGLEGVGKIESAVISIEDEKVIINLNNAVITINLFVSKIIRNTTIGMVSSLKGVGEMNKVTITVKR